MVRNFIRETKSYRSIGSVEISGQYTERHDDTCLYDQIYKMENKSIIQKIVTKYILFRYLEILAYPHGALRKQAVQHLKQHGNYPPREDVCTFIQNLAEELNASVFNIAQSTFSHVKTYSRVKRQCQRLDTQTEPSTNVKL